jgi:hypothetical protein
MPEPFFRVEMLPACHGDALLIEYGTTRARRLLIDAGPIHAFEDVNTRLGKLPEGDQRVELLVITHVDTDHIEGMIRLLAPPVAKWPIAPEEIWFNGWRHLDESTLGGREGEFMSALIHRRAGEKWNTRFNGRAVCVERIPGDRVMLEEDMELTLLSPNSQSLENLLKAWRKHAEKWDIEPGDLDTAWEKLVEENKYHPDAELTLGPEDLSSKLRKMLKGGDSSTANGSSIAFLARFGTKSCMFLGDAHMKVVCSSLERLGATPQNPIKVDAVKMSHHGSKNNITARFFELVDAKHWLISSNGDKFSHPNKEAIQAVIQGSRRKPTLWFNYRSKFNRRWEAPSKKPGAKYATRYPPENKKGIVVKL